MSWKDDPSAAQRDRLQTYSAKADQEVDDELLFHLRSLVDENMAQGMSHDQAWNEAEKRFGSLRRYWIGCQPTRLARGTVVSGLIAGVAALALAVVWLVWETRSLRRQHELATSPSEINSRIAAARIANHRDLAGRVLDQRGQPIGEANVLVIVKTWPDGWFRQDDFTTQTDAAGQFRLAKLIPADGQFAVQVAAMKDGHALTSNYQLKREGQDRELEPIVLRMGDAVPLTLIVQDAHGQPVPGARVVPSVRNSAGGEEHLLYFQGSQPVHVAGNEAGQVPLGCLARGDRADIYVRVPGGDWALYSIEVPPEGDRVELLTSQTAEDHDAEAASARRASPFRLVSTELSDSERKKWNRKLTALKNAGWRPAFALGLELADLAPDEGFDILKKNWSGIEPESARQQILKAWVNTMPYPLHARNHPRLLDVLHLGMHDPSPKVREWAVNYVREVSLADFADDAQAYEEWHAANRVKPTEQVVADSVRALVAKSAQGEQDAASVAELLTHARYTFRDTSAARQAAIGAGLPKFIEKWTADALRSGAAREQIKLAAAGLGVLRYLELEPDDLRRIVEPALRDPVPAEVRSAAVNCLARDDCPWAADVLLQTIKQSVGKPQAQGVIWGAAGALAEIGDPKAIPAMIAVIESDNTNDTVYGVGYYGLGKLTGVEYDEKHDGRWWRAWWEKNKDRYQGATKLANSSARRTTNKRSPPAAPDVADVPAEELQAGGDPNKRYFLIGPADADQAPADGYKLLFVLPGGDGSADFHPFVKRIYKHALNESWLIAQPVAPEWDNRQFDRIVWPTTKDRYPAAKFTTEKLIADILKDVRSIVPLDPRKIFMLGWSSGGPPVYATTMIRHSPITGAFVAMSIFVPSKLPASQGAKGKAFYLLQSPDDQVTRFAFATRAKKTLSAAGANVKIERYAGGHGWRGNVYGMLRGGVAWLEEHAAGEK